MSYTRVNWQNSPNTSTPLSAENLNKMDAGIKQNADDIETLQQHTYDAELDGTSTNAPQNKAVYEAIQQIDIETDPTLTVSGKAADAAATGEAIANVKNAISEIYDAATLEITNTYGIKYLAFAITAGHVYTVKNNTSVTCTVKTCNTQSTSDTVQVVTNGLASGKTVTFTASADAQYLRMYLGSATTGTIKVIDTNSPVYAMQIDVAELKTVTDDLQTRQDALYRSKTTTITSAGYQILWGSLTVGDKLRVTNHTDHILTIVSRTGSTTIETFILNLAVGNSIDITVSTVADGLYTYIASGTTGYVDVTDIRGIIPVLSDRVDSLDVDVVSIGNTVANIFVPINNDTALWEMGTISQSGRKIGANDRCRTKDFVPQGVESVTLVDTSYVLSLFAWDSAGVFVGWWRPGLNEWTADPNQSVQNNNYINIGGLLQVYPGYQFRLVLKKTDISVTDIGTVVKFGHYIPETGEVKRRPLLTFIDDDGYAQSATIWEDIAQTCNIPVTMALVTGNVGVAPHLVTWDDVERLNNIGFEFVSHTNGHINLNDSSLTEETIITDFKNTISALSSHGCASKFVVYPYTFITDANKALVRQYFSCGFSLQNQLNEPYIDKALVHRYDINSGTGEKTIGGETVTVHLFRSLEDMKSIIDNAVIHNGWIVFMSHMRNESGSVRYYYDDDVKQLIVDTVAYARSKNVEITTVGKAYEMYQHIMR